MKDNSITIPGNLITNGEIKSKKNLTVDINITTNSINVKNIKIGNTILTEDLLKNLLNGNFNNITTNNITVKDKGKIEKIYPGKFQSTNAAGGYFHVRGCGSQVSLYNGWNQLWESHVWSENYRKNVKWIGSGSQKYFNYIQGGYFTRGTTDNDTNW